MMYGTRIATFCIAILLSLSLAASAGEVTGLIKFENYKKADADEVNANFNAVKTAVDDNNQKIITLSQPRSASVTYSAMGFTPGKAMVSIDPQYTFVTGFETRFEKNGADGSLAYSGEESGVFYHSVTLRSGVEITRIQARVSGAVKVSLRKQGDIEPVAEVSAEQGSLQDIQVDNINHQVEPFPTSYFIAVVLNSGQRLYSVAIDYTYTEP